MISTKNTGENALVPASFRRSPATSNLSDNPVNVVYYNYAIEGLGA